MINLAKENFVLLLTVLIASIVGCSKQAPDITSIEQSDQDFQVHYTLPAGWETFEVIDNQYGGKDTSIITDVGSLVTVHSTKANTFDEKNAKEYFLRLHVSSALPDGEIRESAKIDFGEVDRERLQGLFARIKTPEPDLADYTIEVFFPGTGSSHQVVVFNTPEDLRSELNEKQNAFLKMVVQ